MEAQIQKELTDARAAMTAKDWDAAYNSYNRAYAHLEDIAGPDGLRKECKDGMAAAMYQAAEQAKKDGNREAAKEYAEKALKLRHPRAEIGRAHV